MWHWSVTHSTAGKCHGGIYPTTLSYLSTRVAAAALGWSLQITADLPPRKDEKKLKLMVKFSQWSVKADVLMKKKIRKVLFQKHMSLSFQSIPVSHSVTCKLKELPMSFSSFCQCVILFWSNFKNFLEIFFSINTEKKKKNLILIIRESEKWVVEIKTNIDSLLHDTKDFVKLHRELSKLSTVWPISLNFHS